MEDLNSGKYDKEQVELMKEECIVIDENDKAIGFGSKKDCKKKKNNNTLFFFFLFY